MDVRALEVRHVTGEIDDSDLQSQTDPQIGDAVFPGDFGQRGLVLYGGIPVKKRQGLVNSFQEDDRVSFMVLSLKAGGTGLNLTAASHVIHFDRWWNPAVEAQAIDRTHRIGQENPVFVYKLLTEGTVEQRVAEMQARKQALADAMLAGGGASAGSLTHEDLDLLFAPLAG